MVMVANVVSGYVSLLKSKNYTRLSLRYLVSY
jgi:hypothetical protein